MTSQGTLELVADTCRCAAQIAVTRVDSISTVLHPAKQV